MHLDENRAIAEEKYIRLHYRIVNYLIRSTTPERNADRELLADEALEKLAEKLEDGYVIEENIHGLTQKIAMGLWLNYNRKHFRNKRWVEVEEHHRVTNQNENEDDEGSQLKNQRKVCGRSCLSEICRDEEEIKIFREYFFRENKNQVDMKSKEQKEIIAKNLNISYSTLKTRMCRLRSKWEKCIKDCMKKHESV